MVYVRWVVTSPRKRLSLQQTLHLANFYLECARKIADPDLSLVMCHETEVLLSHLKKAAKNSDDKTIRERIAAVYVGLGELLDIHGHRNEAQVFYRKSEKWGGRVRESGRPTHLSRSTSFVHSIKGALHTFGLTDKPTPLTPNPHKLLSGTATIPKDIFPENLCPPTIAFTPPEPDSRLSNMPQLACCLGLLQSSIEVDEILDPAIRDWLQVTKNDPDEKERLMTLASNVIRAFKRDEFNNSKTVTEVVCLASVLEKDDFRYLVKEFYSGIESGLLDVHQLEGLVHLIQGADLGYLDADDLTKLLCLLSTRLKDIHQQSTNHGYQLVMAVSRVLDAMADASISGLDREKIHEPLSSYLDELKESSDAFMVYQAAYGYQALMCVPDDEVTLWQATLRRTGKVMQGVFGLVGAVKELDMNGFIEGLRKIQEGLAGSSAVDQVVKSPNDGTVSGESSQGLLSSLKEGLNFNCKRAWYTALRGADTLSRDGQFLDFKRLVCEAPCRRDTAFQWGVCQQLGEVAASRKWDAETRQCAISFLMEIYQNDAVWGNQAAIKQWIAAILMRLSSLPDGEIQCM
ncbi:hypothetical protein BGX34_005256 [Mortierella sp. NVP85]|nr:hypothetical protein BGX34_005256 [Mortierella sp. NVP85]